MFSRSMWQASPEDSSVYFTFDDGPTPEVTKWVLELLDEFNAKGTFFCIGNNVEKHPSIYNSILSQNHSVGNHSYSHLNGWKIDGDTYAQDVQVASQFIQSPLFRPPYGKCNFSQYKSLSEKYTIVMWSILTGDWRQDASSEKIIEKVNKYMIPGSILVFHDSVKAFPILKQVLPQCLAIARARGFNMRALPMQKR